MIQNVNLDPSTDNFIFDKVSGARLNTLDLTNNRLAVQFHLLDGSKKVILVDKIKKQYCGMYYYADNSDNMYFFDDGYYLKMYNAGYIVLNDYDIIKSDKVSGAKIYEKLYNTTDKYLQESIELEFGKTPEKELRSYKIDNENFNYRFSLTKLDNLAKMNEKRKINNLPFYPYNPNMDKFGTIYISVYIQLKYEYTWEQIFLTKIQKSFSVDNVFRSLLIKLNSSEEDIYHFEPVEVRKPIIYSDRSDI